MRHMKFEIQKIPGLQHSEVQKNRGFSKSMDKVGRVGKHMEAK